MRGPKIDPPLCLALDRPDLDQAKRLIDALSGYVAVFKVGLELFTAAGPAAVEAVLERDRDVFLDLKVHDIPNTAAGAVRAAAGIGARSLTVHAAGGADMVRACAEATIAGRPHLLVVSVVTSLDDHGLAEIGVARGISEQVDAMAALAVHAGAPGLVLAAGEVARVRAAHPDLFLLVPGTRPSWAAINDQKRTGTPARALADGADMIVIGRAVTAAADPAAAMERLLAEVDSVRLGS